LQVPEELWVNILGRLDVLDRLHNAALVCKRWKRVALHPLANLILRPEMSMGIMTVGRFQGWLEDYFEHVTVIDVKGPYDYSNIAAWTGLLPAPKLQELRVQSGHAATFAAHISPLLRQCAQLTLLSLGRCGFRDTDQELEAFGPVLAGLRHLDLAGTWHRVAPTPRPPYPQHMGPHAIPGCLLSEQPQLTHLRLSGAITPGTLQRLGACTELQELVLDFAGWDIHARAHPRPCAGAVSLADQAVNQL
jgi:hypothetical protein